MQALLMTPADRARKILIGTGMCLMLVFAIGLDSGRYSMDLQLGWMFPLIGLLLIGIGFMRTTLGQQFPDESDEEMTRRVKNDVDQNEREKNVGKAWASLEQHVLQTEILEAE